MFFEDLTTAEQADGEDAAARFRPIAGSVPEARRFVRTVLGRDHLAPADAELVELIVLAANELTTNAVLHARTDFTVRVLVSAARIRVEVSDGNTRMPQPCLTPADATSGRGLAIIDGSGLRWGAHRYQGGKTVWAQGDR